MGKSNSDTIDKVDVRPSTTNVLLWMMCLTSLGFSAYTSFNQTYFEDRIRHLRLLNDRVSVLEAQIQALPQQWLDRVTVTDATLTEPEEYENIANVVRRLSAQVSGIPRLRRDVSHLKMKRGERQAQQASDCMCPAGITLYSYNFMQRQQT